MIFKKNTEVLRKELDDSLERLEEIKKNPSILAHLVSWGVLIMIGYFIYSWWNYQYPALKGFYCTDHENVLLYKQVEDVKGDTIRGTFKNLGCEEIDEPIKIDNAIQYEDEIVKVTTNKKKILWSIKSNLLGVENMEIVGEVQ